MISHVTLTENRTAKSSKISKIDEGIRCRKSHWILKPHDVLRSQTYQFAGPNEHMASLENKVTTPEVTIGHSQILGVSTLPISWGALHPSSPLLEKPMVHFDLWCSPSSKQFPWKSAPLWALLGRLLHDLASSITLGLPENHCYYQRLLTMSTLFTIQRLHVSGGK